MACATLVSAQPEPSDFPIILEGITVVAAPIDEEDENTETAHQTRIPGDTLQKRFTSVPEILSETAGVQMKRFGGLGDFSSISIRGSSSEQVLIYLDGFQLNTAQGGSVDVAKIPVAQIDSITVYRGSAPLVVGQAGMGGLVNITTKAATRDPAWSYQMQYGSFNTSRLNSTFSFKPGKVDFLLGLNYEQSDNDFEFLSDNGTQFSTSDDVRVKRVNAQFESLNVVTKVGYDLNKKQRLHFYYNGLKSEKGVPGLGAFQSDTASFKSLAHRLSLRWDAQDVFSTGTDLQLGVKYLSKTEQFKDLEGRVGVGRQDNRNKTTETEIALNSEYLLTAHQRLRTRWQFGEERFDPSDRFLSAQRVGVSRQQSMVLALEDQVALFDERLFVTPSLLYEDVRNRFEGDPGISTLGRTSAVQNGDAFLSRQLGLLYRVSGHLSFRANIGKYFRKPSFFELFGDRGGTRGNPDLLPEKGLNRDIGFRWSRRYKSRLRKITIQASYFDNEAEDLILFIQRGQSVARAQNITQSRTIGQEFVAQAQFGKVLFLETNYTHQRAINKSNRPNERNKFLPGRPVHTLFMKTEWRKGRFSAVHRYHFTAENYLDRDNQRNANSRQIHNFGLSIKVHPLFSLTLEAKNFADDQIEDVFGYPLPGRSYFVTFQGAL